MGRAECIGGQFLCLADHRNGVAQIIQRFHAVHVDADALLAQKGGQLRIPPAPFVAGHIERHHPHLSKGLQSFVDRGPVLIANSFVFHLPHLKTKKHKLHLCSLCFNQSADHILERPLRFPGSGKQIVKFAGEDEVPNIMSGMESLYSNKILLLLFIDRFTSLRKRAFRL